MPSINVSSGQTLTVSAGQTSSGVSVLAGGTLAVLAGGTVVSAAVAGTELISGVDSATTVSNGGVETVFAGGQTFGDRVYAGGAFELLSGAVASGTVLGDSTSSSIGGAPPTVTSGGTEYIDNGAADVGAAVGSGAIQTVAGLAANAVVAYGGVQTTVFGYPSGGTAFETTGAGTASLQYGTLSYVEAAGTTVSAVSVLSGSYSGDMLVQSGPGTLLLAQAGLQSTASGLVPVTFYGMDVIGGGTLALAFGGAASSASIVFAPSASGTLLVQNGTDPSYTTSSVYSPQILFPQFPLNSISGFTTGDKIDLQGLTFSGVTTPTVSGNTVTLIEGTHNAVLTLSGASADTFQLAADAVGGTVLTGAAPPVVASGQVLIISAGQTSSGVTVQIGGTLEVLSGGTVVSTTVSGFQTLPGFGGNGGSLIVQSGGTAISTLNFGTTLISGGVDSLGVVVNGGTETVFAGGQLLGKTVSAGGALTLSSGAAAVGTVLSYDIEQGYGGPTGGGFFVVAPGGTETVGSGATDTGALLDAGASQFVAGIAINAVDNLAVQFVSSGGVASNTADYGTLEGPGTFVFTEAAGVTDTYTGTISGAGTLVQSGPGTQALYGSLSNFTGAAIISGGTLAFISPLTLSPTSAATIDFAPGANGVLQIPGITGGSPAPSISGFLAGDVIDLSGLTYSGVTLPTVSGNSVTVTEGTQSATLLIAGAAANTFKLATDTTGGTMLTLATPGTVSSGQTLIISAGQTSSGVTVQIGGTLEVLSGGTVVSATVLGYQPFPGLNAPPGGSLIVLSGGTAISTSNFGTLLVSGGTAIGTLAYGTTLISGGVDSLGIIVNNGSTETVFAGGQVFGKTVSAGGALTLLSGAAAVGTVLGDETGSAYGGPTGGGSVITALGGMETVGSGATDTGAFIGVGASQFVAGISTNAVLSIASIQFVSSGGVASNPAGNGTLEGPGTFAFTEAAGVTDPLSGTISGAGTLVQSGPGTLALFGSLANFSGAAIISGGTLAFISPLTLSPTSAATIDFALGANGVLQIPGITSGSPVPIISGFLAGDVIDFPALTYSGVTLPSVSGNSVTVTEGTQSATLTVAGAAADTFKIATDAAGGTMITLGTPGVVISGQTLTVSAGQTSVGLAVLTGGDLIVLSGGTVLSALVAGTELVSGGTDVAGRIISGGSQTVFAGGLTIGLTVSGGVQTVSSGGLAAVTVADGSLNVLSGGTVSSAVFAAINNAGSSTYLISGGTTVSGNIAGQVTDFFGNRTGGATVVVEGNGSALFTSVGLAATLALSAGAVASGTVLETGVYQTFGGGQPLTFGGGTEIVGSGASATGTVVRLAATQIVSGGVATGTVVSSGGVQTIDAGSLAVGTTGSGQVNDFGTLAYTEAAGVTSGAAAELSGSGLLVQSGPGTLVLSEPAFLLTSFGPIGEGFGGTDVISGGTLELAFGTAASQATILFAPNASGTLLVQNGVDSSTSAFTNPVPSFPTNTISGFGLGDRIDLQGLTFGGRASATVSGNTVTLTEGTQSAVLTIAGASSNTFAVAADATGGTVLTVNTGTYNPAVDKFVTSGQTINSVVLTAGEASFIQPGGTALATDVAGGTLVVNGGLASGSIVAAGNEFVLSGTNFGATVSAGAILFVSGGVDSGTTVFGLEALYGGVASAATISSGGDLTVVGGTAAGTAVGNRGVIAVSGGTASGSTVGSGGNLFVIVGTDAAATVSSGGLVTVSGGADSGSTVLSGGEVAAVNRGAVVSATVSSGGTLLLLGGGTESGALLRGGGVLDLGTLIYGSGGTASFNSATGVLSVTERGVTLRETLAGNYSSFGFALTQDGNGGTLVTAVQSAHAPVTTFVNSGQTLSGVTLASGDAAFIATGGRAVQTDVQSGGTLVVNGGTAAATTVESGGNEYVLVGNNSAGTVSAGGLLTVSGGIDANTVLSPGSMEFVTGSGLAIGATVGSGAVLLLSAGGTQVATTLLSGGSLDLRAFAYAGVSQFAFNSGTDTATFTTGGAVHSAVLAGSYAGLTVGASADSAGGLLITAK